MKTTIEINGIEWLHSTFVFSGGEVQVRLKELQPIADTDNVKIVAGVKSTNDLMELFMLTDAFRRHYPSAPINLVLPYVPYARQDRVCVPGEAIGIAVLAKLINAQGYRTVQIWDPHSDVTTALINNSVVINQSRLLHRMISLAQMPSDNHNRIVVAPDAGALKKANDVFKTLGFAQVINAEKTRNAITGEITGTKVHASQGHTCDMLIVDDICDGGRTFIELAKVLREHTTGKIYLYVTHGIFSKGLDVFNGVIDGVYCANVFNEEDKKHPLMKGSL